jgi:hypothetical protein
VNHNFLLLHRYPTLGPVRKDISRHDCPKSSSNRKPSGTSAFLASEGPPKVHLCADPPSSLTGNSTLPNRRYEKARPRITQTRQRGSNMQNGRMAQKGRKRRVAASLPAHPLAHLPPLISPSLRRCQLSARTAPNSRAEGACDDTQPLSPCAGAHMRGLRWAAGIWPCGRSRPKRRAQALLFSW